MLADNLEIGSVLPTNSGGDAYVVKRISLDHSWAACWVRRDDEDYILNIYRRWRRDYDEKTRERQREWLRYEIACGSQFSDFLCPIDAIQESDNLFGRLTEPIPEGFVSFADVMAQPDLIPSYARRIDICLSMASAFHELHRKCGRCFRYIDYKRILVNPASGRVMFFVGDDLSIDGSYVGDCGLTELMAPERFIARLMGSASQLSDLHSLGVLVFQLLFQQHPLFVGEPRSDLWDLGFGQGFIFEPDTLNNPLIESPDSDVAKKWRSMPQHMRELFCRAFSYGALWVPEARPPVVEWMRELARLRAEVVRCGCGNEVILDGAKGRACDKCGAMCAGEYDLLLPGVKVPVSYDMHVYRCQIDRACGAERALELQARVAEPKYGGKNLAIHNVSDGLWKAMLNDCELTVQPGQDAPVMDGLGLEILGEVVQVCRHVEVERPVLDLFFVVETSGWMNGKPVKVVSRVLQEALRNMRVDGELNERVRIRVSILKFSSRAFWITPNGPQDLESVWVTGLTAGGNIELGAALSALDAKLLSVGYDDGPAHYLGPVVFFIGGGWPTDDYRSALQLLRQNEWFAKAARIGFGIGRVPARDVFIELTETPKTVMCTSDYNVFVKLLMRVTYLVCKRLSVLQFATAQDVAIEAIAEAVRLVEGADAIVK
ncbi:MAG: hypothetical protein IKG21_07470 [Atopobiaceae bacterium]|nr:hypothetical protein [Atopobiaceae bacterium]